ncbi:hypothetical protein PCO31010_04935 [Pandoraea commovens]|uniref:Uncharacterized protein n=1 Tax=Pandoraea commovens TaxID=2508289 RepID=A0A5E4Z302_9BURK|nr:hypothetical protein PCO31010_04935 [Pandoraea commovens]
MKKFMIELSIIIKLITYQSLTISIITAIIKFSVAAYFFHKTGILHFNERDMFSSIKVGLSAGLPLGFGLWILNEIEKSRNDE